MEVALVTYISKDIKWYDFLELLTLDVPLYIFGPSAMEGDVFELRNNSNTEYIVIDDSKRISGVDRFIMLHRATIVDSFNSIYFFWIDYSSLNLIKDRNLLKPEVFNKIQNVGFTFLTGGDIPGFKPYDSELIQRYTGQDRYNYICRKQFFGGNHFMIQALYNVYLELVVDILSEVEQEGDIENILTILRLRNSDIVDAYHVSDEGLERYLRETNN